MIQISKTDETKLQKLDKIWDFLSLLRTSLKERVVYLEVQVSTFDFSSPPLIWLNTAIPIVSDTPDVPGVPDLKIKRNSISTDNVPVKPGSSAPNSAAGRSRVSSSAPSLPPNLSDIFDEGNHCYLSLLSFFFFFFFFFFYFFFLLSFFSI